MLQTIIRHSLRVPRTVAPAGDGSAVARQLDVVLLSVGFKADRALLEHLSTVEFGAAMDLASAVVEAVRGLVGDHVQHNAYFKKFPRRVPDTVEFWVSCLRHTGGAEVVDLLTLPAYGRYQHSFADLLAAHDELIASVKDRVTVVHLGGTLEEEIQALYRALAESVTPLGEADLQLLAELAGRCGHVELAAVPVRENRAVLNAARLAAGRPLVAVDTVVDVLRTACHASGASCSPRSTGSSRTTRASSVTCPASPSASSGWAATCTPTRARRTPARARSSTSPAATARCRRWPDARSAPSPTATSRAPPRS